MNNENAKSPHQGGNINFWNDNEVSKYDIKQKMIVEHKDKVIDNIVRIARFFVKKYDFIVSSLALHYLSDERRDTFFKEIHDHLKENGVFIACIGNLSNISEINEMEQIFKAEYAYENIIKQENYLKNFDTFLTKFKNRQKEMNINWRDPADYLIALENAGFEKSDIVWHIWVKSIYVAIK